MTLCFDKFLQLVAPIDARQLVLGRVHQNTTLGAKSALAECLVSCVDFALLFVLLAQHVALVLRAWSS